MRSRSTLLAGGTALVAAALSVALIAPANADIAPSASDIVGVGSDTVQNMANFLADGDPFGSSSGINSAGGKNRLFSFDATPDANARAGYLQGSTSAVQKPLQPTIVLRAGKSPVQRPNGSSAGIGALLADVAPRQINYVRSSRLPSSAEQGNAGAGAGGLHVIKISTDPLKTATATVSNAPATMTITQLVDIYKCLPTANNWSQFGGTAGTIIPQVPQTGSGTRSTFLADLQAANGNVAVPLGGCVEVVEENDPTSITGSASPVNTIAPFSEGRNNLYASGYFKSPAAAFPGSVTPLASGVKMQGGYVNVRGLFIVFKDADKNSLVKWQPGSNLNFVQALFLAASPTAPAPYVSTADGQAAIASGGGTPVYVDCGSGTGVTLATCP